MSFPVVGEIWNLFEATLNVQAKKLVEDIAKKQGANPKELWNKVRPQIKIAPIDSDLPDPLPVTCPFYSGIPDGCIYTRCRQACLLGFERCPKHINKPEPKVNTENPLKRILDFENKVYFVDEHGIAYDKSENPVGTVEDDELKLWDVVTKEKEEA
jgi:hypothetical protein